MSTEKKRALIPPNNSPDKDIVMTPQYLANEVVSYLPLYGTVLEPAAGTGAFVNAMKPLVGNTIDELHSCELSEGTNFLDWDKKVDWVVSNPPWSKHRDFTNHAYTIAENIVWLITVNHCIGYRARLRDMKEAGWGVVNIIKVDPPQAKEYPDWPQSGFQLGVVWYQKGYNGPMNWDDRATR